MERLELLGLTGLGRRLAHSGDVKHLSSCSDCRFYMGRPDLSLLAQFIETIS